MAAWRVAHRAPRLVCATINGQCCEIPAAGAAAAWRCLPQPENCRRAGEIRPKTEGNAMTRLSSALAGVLLLTTLTAAPAALAQNPAATPQSTPPSTTPTAATDPKTIVARVDGATITAGDVAAAYEDLPPEYRQMPIGVLYPQLLDQLINRKLMLKAALAQKLDEDEAIRAEVREFEHFAIQRAYLDRFIAEKVSDAALRTEYETTIGAETGKEQIKASHILLQSEDAAKAVIEEIADGADFAKVAREKSTGPSASSGGELGFFGRDQMVAPFAEAAFAMQDGETSTAPVKTQFGWHVIKVTGRRTQPPPAFEEVRDKLQDRLTRAALAAHMAALREATPVEKFNPDGTPMAQETAR
jgi:peptidyl-prolyl cis-trans isomerase C